MISVFVVDEFPAIRLGLRWIFEREGDIKVGCETGNGNEVLDLLVQNDVSMMILDVNLSGSNGIALLQELKEGNPNFPVLIFSNQPESVYATKVLKAGASGFLHKSASSNEIVRAVRKVAAKGIYISSIYAERLASELQGSLGKLPHEKLTEREFQILRLIGMGKTLSQIGKELFISVKTVGTHRASILAKMKFRTSMELMNYCFKEGLIMEQ